MRPLFFRADSNPMVMVVLPEDLWAAEINRGVAEIDIILKIRANKIISSDFSRLNLICITLFNK